MQCPVLNLIFSLYISGCSDYQYPLILLQMHVDVWKTFNRFEGDDSSLVKFLCWVYGKVHIVQRAGK